MRIAVASGKGGTGKTTVAVNLAVTVARSGLQVHLCDCDVEEPNAAIYLDPQLGPAAPVSTPIPLVDNDLCNHCGQCASICEFNAIACLPRQTLVFPDLCHSCSGCWLVCPEQAITQADRVLGEVSVGSAGPIGFTQGVLRIGETVVPPLIHTVKATVRGAPWVILDAPPGTTCPAVEALRGADFAVLVTEPTPFGLHDLDLAAKLARGLDIPCGVVENRAIPGREIVDRYCAEKDLPVLARIPFTRDLAAVGSEGGLLVDADADVAAAFTHLLDELVGLEARA
ncbi:MAG: ATP-binding protein [bacterium]